MVAGYEWDIDEMMRAGRRVFYLKRLINRRYGLTAADDDLTPRMLEPARDGEPEGIEMDLAGMKDKFYSLVQMDPEKGIPGKEILEEYGMARRSAIGFGESDRRDAGCHRLAVGRASATVSEFWILDKCYLGGPEATASRRRRHKRLPFRRGDHRSPRPSMLLS